MSADGPMEIVSPPMPAHEAFSDPDAAVARLIDL